MTLTLSLSGLRTLLSKINLLECFPSKFQFVRARAILFAVNFTQSPTLEKQICSGNWKICSRRNSILSHCHCHSSNSSSSSSHLRSAHIGNCSSKAGCGPIWKRWRDFWSVFTSTRIETDFLTAWQQKTGHGSFSDPLVESCSRLWFDPPVRGGKWHCNGPWQVQGFQEHPELECWQPWQLFGALWLLLFFMYRDCVEIHGNSTAELVDIYHFPPGDCSGYCHPSWHRWHKSQDSLTQGRKAREEKTIRICGLQPVAVYPSLHEWVHKEKLISKLKLVSLSQSDCSDARFPNFQ